MLLDFSTPDGLVQLQADLKDVAPQALYYPEVESQVKVQGELFVADMASSFLPADKMLMLVERFDSRIPALLRAVTGAGS